MKHKHAELIHAWADGAEIQVRKKSGWKDMQQVIWLADMEYRIKPKEKIVRWQWIIKAPDTGRVSLVSTFFSEEEMNQWKGLGTATNVIGKAEWTRTEFDE